MSGLISRWADNESLVSEAVKEDVQSHNQEDPFKKVRESKIPTKPASMVVVGKEADKEAIKEASAVEEDEDEWEDFDGEEDDKEDEEEDEAEDEAEEEDDDDDEPVLGHSKPKLSKETQRLFSSLLNSNEVASDEEDKTDNGDEAKGAASPGKNQRNRRLRPKKEAPILNLSKKQRQVAPLPTPPGSASKETEKSGREKHIFLPSRWANESSSQQTTPPFSASSEKGHRYDDRDHHRGNPRNEQSRGDGRGRARRGRKSRGSDRWIPDEDQQTDGSRGKGDLMAKTSRRGQQLGVPKEPRKSREWKGPMEPREPREPREPKKPKESVDYDQELKDLMKKFDAKSSWADTDFDLPL